MKNAINNKVMKPSRLLGAFSAGIICLSAGMLQAQLIDVDFNGNSVGTAYAGGGVASPGPNQSGAALIGSAGDVWNGIADSQLTFATYPSGITATALPLTYATGASSPVTMTIASDGGTYNANEPAWSNTSAFTTAASPYSNLMQDLIYANAATGGTITLSGLAANQAYNLVLYNAGDQNVGGDRASAFIVNGVSQTSQWDGTTSTLVAGVSYVDYSSAMSDGSGNLVITFGAGMTVAGALSSEGDLDGFQLQAVPEPSTWAMLAAGGVIMLLGYRRSFRRA
jgi:PEP-CTERM motif